MSESRESEEMRMVLAKIINTNPLPDRAAVEEHYGPCWDTEELKRDFEVIGFLAPFVAVERKSDGQKGSLMFQHYPRFYFSWEEHR